MYFNDHAPPHFHVEYAEFKTTVEIYSLTLKTGVCAKPNSSRGRLPRYCKKEGHHGMGCC